jgi:tyrosyl-tRNA synthetase
MIISNNEIETLRRNVIDLISEEELKKKINTGKKLNIKLGADPTAPDLHFGHAVVLEKLKQFQDLGHQIIFVIGDFTALIGDPSGRSKVRKQIGEKEIKENAQTYVNQVSKILDINKAQIRYNSEWLSKIDTKELLRILSNFTLARILERDDFIKRYKANIALFMHEFMYPIMQAYDSVAINADVELGGTDQKFNLLLGRDMQILFNQVPQIVMTMPLLIGTDGTVKMSKSIGNYIGITEEPNTIYGKIMSIPDNLIHDYYKLILNYDPLKLEEIKKKLLVENPMTYKMILARKVVEKYFNKNKSIEAENNFIKIHREHQTPEIVDTMFYNGMLRVKIVDLIFDLGLINSKSEIKRLVAQGGIYINEAKVTDCLDFIDVVDGMQIRIGKRKFSKIKIQNHQHV